MALLTSDPDRRDAPSPPPANPAVQALGSVAGALASTLVTSHLGGSPTANLAAAALGAAVPPLATHAGPLRQLRLGVALATIVLAFALTYGSVAAVDAATDAKTFPGPVPEPKHEPQQAQPQGQSGGGPVSSGGARVGIRVTPDPLSCTPDGCDEPVFIESTRAGTLRVSDIEIRGDGREQFSVDGACERVDIERGTPCRVAVAYTPAPDGLPRSAELVIHHNAGDQPTTVALAGTGTPPAQVGDLAFEAATCTIENGQTARLALSVSAPADLSAVPLTVTQPEGTTTGDSVTPGGPDDVAVALASEPTGPVTLTVTLDPGSTIDEAEEGNNVLPVNCEQP